MWPTSILLNKCEETMLFCSFTGAFRKCSWLKQRTTAFCFLLGKSRADPHPNAPTYNSETAVDVSFFRSPWVRSVNPRGKRGAAHFSVHPTGDLAGREDVVLAPVMLSWVKPNKCSLICPSPPIPLTSSFWWHLLKKWARSLGSGMQHSQVWILWP